MKNKFQKRLELRRRKETEAIGKLESMIPLAESLLQKDDLASASIHFESLWRQCDRIAAIEKRFLETVYKYPPASNLCKECGNKEEWAIRVRCSGADASARWSCEWELQPCRGCAEAGHRAQLGRQYVDIMSRNGFPPRFFDAQWDSVPPSSSRALSSDRGAFFFGPCGTGKTYTLSAYGRHLIMNTPICERRIDNPCYYPSQKRYLFPNTYDFPRFVSVPRLLMDIRASFNTNEPSESEVIRRLSNVGVLMLDDLGSEKATDWGRQVLYLIIENRYSHMRRTIISSNLSLAEISKGIDDRIASRIADMCQIIQLQGEDMRLNIN